MPKTDLNKLAAAYIRMSTDKQEDSPARQRAEIERYAAAHGYTIVAWYEDHGKTGTTSAKRPGFQRLMADARQRQFQFVLLYEQSRFSREDMLQFAHHLYELREVGVALVTTLKGVVEADDIGGLFMTLLESYKARSESETIGHRCASGIRKKVLDDGQRFGGNLFGFDRLILDRTGIIVKRVHFSERYKCAPDQTSMLAPSGDAKAVEAVRWAFRSLLAGASINSLCVEFNTRGLVTFRGNPWRRGAMDELLRNPAYCGRLRFGLYANGRFARATDSVVIRDGAHEGIVTAKTFDAAQDVLHARHRTRTPLVNGRYLLAGRVLCGACGMPMVGAWSNRDGCGRYRCTQFDLSFQRGACQNSVSSGRLEQAVLKVVKSLIATDDWLLAADAAHLEQAAAVQPSPLAARIEELESKIDTATDRLAGDVLDEEEFAAVSKRRRKWRDELNQLKREATAQNPPRTVQPLLLDQLRLAAANLHLTERGALRDMLLGIIESVTVLPSAVNGVRASIVFSLGVAPVSLSQDDIFPDVRWRRAANFILAAGRDVRFAEVANELGVSNAQTALALGIAVGSGEVRKLARGLYAGSGNPSRGSVRG
jgi:DNA invertase Pin-like site-specific DNA recombinase